MQKDAIYNKQKNTKLHLDRTSLINAQLRNVNAHTDGQLKLHDRVCNVLYYFCCLHFLYIPYRSSWVKIYGTVYKPQDIVVVSNDLLPTFGRIQSILITDMNKCYFVCELLHTICFNSHYHAYEVSIQAMPMSIVIRTQNEFVDHHILSLYHISNLNFISLKYSLPHCF